ncbi:MAG: AAA family ATPase, partial [Defluviitaleaceae bacterium]|nr:AAA family ATPase [Defluviitaleaceae bacterium]
MEQVEIIGTVESEIFHNEANGFTVFSLEVKDEDVNLVCVGNIPMVKEGEYVKLRGTYVVHAVYGKQLKVERFERALPESELGIERYLASGAIKGIRAKLAKKIVERFGKDTLDVLENYPERLAEIKGIPLARAEQISTEFNEQNMLRRTVVYLQGHGVTYAQAKKLYERYREATIDVVKENPYLLAEEIDGIGFKTADGIARRMGLPADSPHRIRSAIKYVLSGASAEGHTYLPKENLIAAASELLETDISLIENMFSQLLIERSVIQERADEQNAVYLNMFYYAEAVVAKKLLELQDRRTVHLSSQAKTDEPSSCLAIEAQIAQIEAQTEVYLADNQKAAVISALTHGVLVITGGPGTGKTTTIKTIIGVLQRSGAKIALAAPTGRAAKRMSEATGMEAKTIHRLLEIAF